MVLFATTVTFKAKVLAVSRIITIFACNTIRDVTRNIKPVL